MVRRERRTSVEGVRRCERAIVAVAVLFGLGAAAAATPLAAAPKAAGSGEIVFPSNRSGERELYVVNGDGSGVHRLTFNGLTERRPVWSPDRTRIAFPGRDATGQWDLYVVNADGTGQQRLTNDSAFETQASWTADGRDLVYTRYASASFDCPCEAWIVHEDGSRAQRLDTGAGAVDGVDASPNGRRIAFGRTRQGANEMAIYVGEIGGGKPRRITDAPGESYGDFRPRWSPDGGKIAFLRDVTGVDNDVYIVDANGKNEQRLTDTPDFVEGQLSWSPDGRRLIVGSRDGGGIVTIPADGGASTDIPTALTAPLSDSFDDGVRDGSVWHQVVTGTGTTIDETGGGVQVSIDGGAVASAPPNYIEGHFGLQCSMPGDYDIQVDYTLLDWPMSDGISAGLTLSGSPSIAELVDRAGFPWGEQYTANLGGGVFGFTPTADTSGAVRMVRSAGVTTAYYGKGAAWSPVPGATSLTSGDRVPVIGAFTSPAVFGRQSARVAFDNFRVNSGAFTCPSWWDAGAGDWR